jgi:hypothetical protein
MTEWELMDKKNLTWWPHTVFIMLEAITKIMLGQSQTQIFFRERVRHNFSIYDVYLIFFGILLLTQCMISLFSPEQLFGCD